MHTCGILTWPHLTCGLWTLTSCAGRNVIAIDRGQHYKYNQINRANINTYTTYEHKLNFERKIKWLLQFWKHLFNYSTQWANHVTGGPKKMMLPDSAMMRHGWTIHLTYLIFTLSPDSVSSGSEGKKKRCYSHCHTAAPCFFFSPTWGPCSVVLFTADSTGGL